MNNKQIKFIYLPEIDSTNKFAKDNLAKFDHKTVITADKQTHGKGRLSNRTWISNNPLNLYFSLILKFDANQENHNNMLAYLPTFTHLCSVALCETLDIYLAPYRKTALIKWPNDVFVDNKKIAGILAESSADSTTLSCILGIGINLFMSDTELANIDKPATSLNKFISEPINKKTFLNKYIEHFFNHYPSFIQFGFESIKELYTQKSLVLNKMITFNATNQTIIGTVESFSSDGTMNLKLADNKGVNIFNGEIQDIFP